MSPKQYRRRIRDLETSLDWHEKAVAVLAEDIVRFAVACVEESQPPKLTPADFIHEDVLNNVIAVAAVRDKLKGAKNDGEG